MSNLNVKPEWQNLPVEEIKTACLNNTINAAVCMVNVEGDFNFSTMVRNANFFGFKEVHYCGKKKWDKRGAVGTYNYTPIYYHEDEESFIESCNEYDIICIENNFPYYEHKTFEITNGIFLLPHRFNLSKAPLFVFGSENMGLSDLWLDRCASILTIKGYGSVRSLNVGTTSGIIMSAYRQTIESQKKLAEMFPLEESKRV